MRSGKRRASARVPAADQQIFDAQFAAFMAGPNLDGGLAGSATSARAGETVAAVRRAGGLDTG